MRFSILAIRQPSSSRSSASAFRTRSKVTSSIALSRPCMLSCLDMSRPPLAFDMNDSAALCGSGVPCGFPNPYCDANDRLEN